MKRFSLLAAVASVSLLGALAVGATSASATVLCNQAAPLNVCGAENVYPNGTTMHAELAAGTEVKFMLPNGSSYPWNVCKHAGFDMTVTNAGGLGEEVTSSVSNIEFGECEEGAVEAVPIAGGPQARFTWKPETHTGTMYMISAVKVPSFIYGLTSCIYNVGGPGDIVAGENPSLVWGSSTEAIKYAGGYDCPKRLKLLATFQITGANPLYIENY